MPLRDWFRFSQPISDEEFLRQRDQVLKQAPVPLFWLLGKTGSGKTSVIKFLTGATDAEIGSGFRPQTKNSRIYEFPSGAAPLLQFLDTRGLGEAGYSPQEDVERFSGTAHLIIVTVRAMDHALADLIETLTAIRSRSPDRSILLTLTCLHDAYPGRQHGEVFPSGASALPGLVFAKEQGTGAAKELTDLQRSLAMHRERFAGLVDRIVAVDLTPPDEGFDDPHFGGDQLKEAIIELLPSAYRQSLLRIEQTRDALKDLHLRRTWPVILGYSSLAASAAAVPLPWIDIPLVMGLQTRLIYRLAGLHRQPIDGKTIARASGTLGGRVALRMATRELLKAIPWAGSTINAAAAFAYTFATGMAWNWYFTEVKGGHVPTPAELEHVFSEQLKRGARLWSLSRRQADEASTEKDERVKDQPGADRPSTGPMEAARSPNEK